jgi:hypothetical protein
MPCGINVLNLDKGKPLGAGSLSMCWLCCAYSSLSLWCDFLLFPRRRPTDRPTNQQPVRRECVYHIRASCTTGSRTHSRSPSRQLVECAVAVGAQGGRKPPLAGQVGARGPKLSGSGQSAPLPAPLTSIRLP